MKKRVKLGIGCTVRGPAAQGRLWCRSRTREEVLRRKDIMFKLAPRLSNYIKEEWAAIGPQVVLHLPGASFHQWGEAVDLFVDVRGKAAWDGSAARLIADAAKELGLHHTIDHTDWVGRTSRCHVQLSKYETPLHAIDPRRHWEDVEFSMAERFELE